MGWHRRSWHCHTLGDGPPRFLRFLLVLFVTVGSLVAGVWYAIRDTPKGESWEEITKWSLPR
jgi:hypothetical protein